jgi:hypothetical protein
MQTAPYATDPPDVWDKMNKVSNAELAARLGSPMIFDRRGTMYWYDNFNSSPLKWRATGTGTLTLSNEKPLYDDGCMKIVTPTAAGAYQRADIYLGGLSHDKIGVESSFRFEDDVTTLSGITIQAYTGSRVITAGVSIQNSGSGGLKYLNGGDPTVAADWTTFDDTFNIYTTMYYPLKFAIDLDAEKYVRCMFCGEEIDMSAYTPHALNSTDAQLIQCNIISISVGVATPKTYVNNFILTIEEPA